jgi:flagellar biosynthesis protein
MTWRRDRAEQAQPQAAALRYDAGADLAPRVVAKGRGALAEEIVRRARDSGVPIHESRELVAALMQFEMDQQIPAALYVAVAEVLAWVYQLEARALNP